jgi:hypothetical protein
VTQVGLPRSGDIGIRALVRARLLGLQILTLDAQVIVAKQHPEAASQARPDSPERPGRPAALALASPVPEPRSGNRLARAALLLEQGAQTLEHSRDLASW